MNSKYFNNRQVPAQQRRVLLLGIMALRTKFDFGSARIERWIDEINDLKESYEKGYISVQDLQQTIKEETGIEIKF